MTQHQTGVEVRVLARITKEPQLARTVGGMEICRFVVATDAGPASNPVVKPIYALDDPMTEVGRDLPGRCAGLSLGDLVLVSGRERQRVRRRGGVSYTESVIETTDVRLRARPAEAL